MKQIHNKWITGQAVYYNLINLNQVCFEVTDACNLACHYCVYRDLYIDHDERSGAKMSYEMAKNVIDYLCRIWEKHPSEKIDNPITISFYGGEPLINIDLIKRIVDYLEHLHVGRRFVYSMTTNAVLLNQHLDYLAKHKFSLLISLDGDKDGNSYREFKSGSSSFDTVFSNISRLKETYPDYFSEHVNFNSVLHNRNDVDGLLSFFSKHFGKTPSISEVNPRGLDPSKEKAFLDMYKNKQESIESSSRLDTLEGEMFTDSPKTRSLCDQIIKISGNFYGDYLQLISYKKKLPYRPCAGTCIPFGKKMFITVNGKILQCERIGQSFPLGMVDTNGVHLDSDEVAKRFNAIISNVHSQCSHCARRDSCFKCVYNIDKIETNKPICTGFCSTDSIDSWKESNREYLAEHPYLFDKIRKTMKIL